MTRLARYGVFIILAALLGVSLFSAPPGRAQTRAWLSFIDDTIGFTIRYPAGWVPVLVADNADRRPDYGDDVAWRSVGFFGPDSRIVFIDWWQNPDNLTPRQWLAQYPPPLSLDPNLTVSTRHASVAGRQAVYLEGRPAVANAGIPWHIRAQFRQKEWMVAVEYAALTPDFDLFQAMLGSFAPLPQELARLRATPLSSELPPAAYGVTEATCCGYSDPEYNPFPCNTAGDATCSFPPCGNCTWWVRYRRTGDAIANLDRCTNDAVTWGACASQYYPYLLSPFPDVDAVVLYAGQNHLSFVESNSGSGAFTASDLSWYDPCPANPFYSSYDTANKNYILHPYRYETNKPPNPPSLNQPAAGGWLAEHSLTLRWTDEGDPDDGPASERRFNVSLENDDGWRKYSGWINRTRWDVDAPADGSYTWRVKAHDGMLESNWSASQVFHIDAAPPETSITAMPAPGRWTNQEQSITFGAADPAPGIGLDALKWGWDVSPPAQSTGSAAKTIALSSAGQGQHTLYLQALDKLGNASAVQQAGWFGYDTVPPVITFSSENPPATRWYSRSVTITFAAADPSPGAGVAQTRRRWTDGPPETATAGEGGAAILPPVQGPHSLSVWAVDRAGNVAPTAGSDWFGYDSLIPNPPQITVSCAISNNQPQNTCPAPTFEWAAADPGAGAGGLTYATGWGASPTIAGGVWATATTFSPPPLPDGVRSARYFLRVRAKDGAGNVSSAATFGFWYDETASGSMEPPQPATFGLTLAGGRLFTRVPTVTLRAWGPNVTHARIDGAAGWQTLPVSATHILTSTPSYTIPRRVSGRFKDADGLEFGPFFDDIIFDPVSPRGNIHLAAGTELTLTLTIFAWDDNSGIAAMRVGTWAAVTQTAWLSFSRAITRPAAGGVVYAQFADRAGNVSPVYGTDGSDSSLTEHLYLPVIRR